jgi:hypothetical protein
MNTTTKTMMAVVALALAAGISACTSGPQFTDSYSKVLQAGGPPKPDYIQVDQAIGQYIHAVFKDPSSIQDLRVLSVVYNNRAAIHKDWVIAFSCNAKNSFGGYVGNKNYFVLWNGTGIDWDGMNDPARAMLRGMYEGVGEERPFANL